MDLQARKYEFIEKLFKVEEDVFEKLEDFLEKTLSKPISLSQYNKEIDEAIADIENDNFYTEEQAKEMARKW